MLRILALAAAGLLLAGSVSAADIAVLPVGLSLGAGHERAAITVTNQGQEPVVMQVETVSWQQVDGEDRYAPTRDLLVNPPLFTVKPGRRQILRVGLRQPPDPARETAYRLILREVPPPPAKAAPSADAGQGQVRVLLQMRLPVYVPPAQVVEALQWQARRAEDGAIAVSLANAGSVHVVVSELKLRGADAAPGTAPLAAVKGSNVVFPGQGRTWHLRPAAAPGQRFMLEVTTDRGPRDVALDLGST